jgi:predicted dehydrogenase
MIFDYGFHLWAIAMWFLGDVQKVYAWITHRPTTRWGILDSPAVVIWKYRNAEKYGSYETIASENILITTKYFAEDEWIEVTGSAGFIWINRCSAMLLDRPPLVMYRDGITTEFSNLDTDWATSFVKGAEDFVDAILEGRLSHLTGEEGKAVLQFARAAQLSAKEGREVRPEEIK